MKFPLRQHLLSAPLAFALALPAVAQEAPPAPDVTLSAAGFAPSLLRTDSISGAYELVHWAEEGLLFVASVPSFEAGTAGYIQVLSADDLRPLRQIRLERRPFALALDRKAGRLYAGNTTDGSLTVIDARSGQVLDVIQLGLKSGDDGAVEHTRMIALDEERGLAFVTSPGEPEGATWIVDTRAGVLLHRIDGGLWTAGAAYDAKAGRFYASGGGRDEILVIGADGALLDTISTGDTQEAGAAGSKHFFVNLAIDPESQRLFAADANSGSIYIFDIATKSVLAQVPLGMGTLDVIHNPARAEIYATWRGASHADPTGTGGLVVINADSYAVTSRLALPPHPNSLELSADGQQLFVTVKMAHDKRNPTWVEGGLDSVLRFDLARLAQGLTP